MALLKRKTRTDGRHGPGTVAGADRAARLAAQGLIKSSGLARRRTRRWPAAMPSRFPVRTPNGPASGTITSFDLGQARCRCPGTAHRADEVVAALHDDTGNFADQRDVAQQLVVAVQETAVDEIVALDPRKRRRVFGDLELRDVSRTRSAGGWWPPPRSTRHARPRCARACRCWSGAGNRRASCRSVRPPGCGATNRSQQIRIQRRRAVAVLVEPLQFRTAQQEDAAQHQLGDPRSGDAARRPAPASIPRIRRTPASDRLPRCSRSRSMSATRSQVVFSSRLACGVLLPHPRWSNSTMR